MKTFFQLIKLKHWIKNLFIFAPLIFSLSLFEYNKVIKSIIAFFSFSFVAVLVYIINDIKDKDSDAQHKIKASRPIASGKVKPKTALLVGISMALLGLISAFFLGISSIIIILMYFSINILYTFILKNIVILDVIIIATGFCLRVLLGSRAIDVTLSHWMLLATFCISLIIGFGKRRHELLLLGNNAHIHRNNLREYNKEFLDMMIIISTSLTAISYALYTMDPEVIKKFGTDGLIFTLPFVLYGLFRYLLLIYCKGKGGKPQELVASDPGIIITVIIWISIILFQIYFKHLLKLDLNFMKLLKGFFESINKI